jgi:(R,R)-butanediol dehydrogenase/meso-butanediol dehydrogenase/diacetyl reductase
VDVVMCGVCGTDLHHWRSGSTSRPSIFGHEWLGRVTGVGENVDSVAAGDRVVLAAPPSCGDCRYCLSGLTDECEHVYDVITGGGPVASAYGGFASAVAVLASRLMAVPDGLSDAAAALVEPTAVVMHGLLRSPVPVGGTVVVQGAGPIGLLAVQAVRAMGASDVIVVEPDTQRRLIAEGTGATVAIAPGDHVAARMLDLTAGIGADLVIECSGVPSIVSVASTLVRRAGVLLLLGYPKGTSEIDAGAWMRKRLRVDSSIGCVRRDFEVAIRLIETGQIDPTPLHTSTTGLTGLESVLEDLGSARPTQIKALIKPS